MLRDLLGIAFIGVGVLTIYVRIVARSHELQRHLARPHGPRLTPPDRGR